MFTAIMLKLLIAIVAVVLFLGAQFVVLRVFDKLLGIDFKEAFNKIEVCPKSMSFYFGMRYLATAITIGFIVCICFIL